MILHSTSSVVEVYFDSVFIRMGLLTQPATFFSLFCSVFQMLSSTLAVRPFSCQKSPAKEGKQMQNFLLNYSIHLE